MNKNIDFFTVSCADGADAELASRSVKNGIELYEFKFTWTLENASDNAGFEVKWRVPMLDYMYRWNPSCGKNRHIGPDWAGFSESMTSAYSPVDCIFDGNGNNKYTYALSECSKLFRYRSGVYEETGELNLAFAFNTAQYTNKLSAFVTLRVDKRNVPMNTAVSEVAEWWETECKMAPAFVPADAKEPVYSFWYSYHQQLHAKEIEEECKRAKSLGFNVCILDDGWQTSDSNHGYAYCGEWMPSETKIPDMRANVEAVHKLGMKYILWYSVPFMGCKVRNLEQFKNMVLRYESRLDTAVLDPRYKKVRDYLVNIYKTALSEWGLDGFKLDFIDQWREPGDNAPYNEGMDIESLQDAVDVFMTDVVNTLRAIKPDILLEFRQGYIGPNMRKYGNMFRVADCPNDYISNRVGVLDLRMLMRNTAVHSDMLMWNRDEKPETAALQIISILFGVMQYSAKLENMPKETEKMSRFWLSFMKEHKKLLLEAPLSSYEPQLLYTWAKASDENECMTAVYSNEKCVTPDDKTKIYIANGSMAERVIADISGNYLATVQNCFGDTVSQSTRSFGGVSVIGVPVGGLATLVRV